MLEKSDNRSRGEEELEGSIPNHRNQSLLLCPQVSGISDFLMGEDLVARLGLQWAEQVRELCVVLT